MGSLNCLEKAHVPDEKLAYFKLVENFLDVVFLPGLVLPPRADGSPH